MATNKTTAVKIAEQRAKMEQMENEIKRLLRLQKEEERKARTHRICERGGLLESLLPDTIALTHERFKTFLEKTTANDFGRRTLAALMAEQEKENAVNIPAGKEESSTAKTTATVQNTVKSNDAQEPEAARQAG